MISLTPTSGARRNPKLCPIDPENRIRFGEFITVGKRRIYLSDCLWDRLGLPEFVQFALDAKEKVFGVKKSDEHDPYAVKINMLKSGGVECYTVSNIVSMIQEMIGEDFDFSDNYVTFKHGESIDGYFAFRLVFADKYPVKRRKKNGK